MHYKRNKSNSNQREDSDVLTVGDSSKDEERRERWTPAGRMFVPLEFKVFSQL